MQIGAISSQTFKGQEDFDLSEFYALGFERAYPDESAPLELDLPKDSFEKSTEVPSEVIKPEEALKANKLMVATPKKSLTIEDELENLTKATELSKKLVDSDDMKGPVAATAAVAYAGVKSFLKGAKVAFGADVLFGNKPSKAAEKGLRKGAKFVENLSANLKNSNGKKLSKIANYVGNGLEKAEGFAKTAYKTIAKNSSVTGFIFVAGIISAAALLPGLLKKDGNNDGVADIMQKSQNVYAQNSQKLDNLQEKISIAAEISQLLT